jgi:hypothetical protein
VALRLGLGFWISSDARASLTRVEASESADFNFVAGSHGTDDAVKYGADDNVGFLLGQLSGLTNRFSQISPGHLEPLIASRKRVSQCSFLSRTLPSPGWSATTERSGYRRSGIRSDLGGGTSPLTPVYVHWRQDRVRRPCFMPVTSSWRVIRESSARTFSGIYTSDLRLPQNEDLWRRVSRPARHPSSLVKSSCSGRRRTHRRSRRASVLASAAVGEPVLRSRRE